MPLTPLHRWDSVPHPRAAVQIVHGMCEHAGRYARFARELNRAGFVAWAHDHRGHGRNRTPPVGLGHFGDADGWRLLVDDTWTVSEQMRETFRSIPLVLFAHSMGSFVAQTLMAEHGSAYAGVVLCATNGPPGPQELVVRGLARAQRIASGGRHPGSWPEKVVLGLFNRPFSPSRTRFDWLSRDEREVDAHVEDDLCGFSLSAQSWLDFLVGKQRLGSKAHMARIPKGLPVYLIAGTRDPVGEETRGVRRLLRLYGEAGLTNVTHRFYDGARHELLNETNRDEVSSDVIAWIEGLDGVAVVHAAGPVASISGTSPGSP